MTFLQGGFCSSKKITDRREEQSLLTQKKKTTKESQIPCKFSNQNLTKHHFIIILMKDHSTPAPPLTPFFHPLNKRYNINIPW